MAVAQKDLKYFKEHLRCAICLESYEDPRMLPCDHSFCLKCLAHHIQETLSNNEFQCPTCRESTQTRSLFYDRITQPASDIANSFPQNVLLAEFERQVRVFESDLHFCDSHSSVPAQYVCITDLTLLCQKCAVETHRSEQCQVVEGRRVNECLKPQLGSLKENMDTKIKYLEDEIKMRLDIMKTNTIKDIDNFVKEIEQTVKKIYEDAEQLRKNVETFAFSARYQMELWKPLTDLRLQKTRLTNLESNESTCTTFGKTIKDILDIKTKLLKLDPIPKFPDSVFVKNSKTEAVTNELRNKTNLLGNLASEKKRPRVCVETTQRRLNCCRGGRVGRSVSSKFM